MIQSTLFSIITGNYNFILWVIRDSIVFSTLRMLTLLYICIYIIHIYIHMPILIDTGIDLNK